MKTMSKAELASLIAIVGIVFPACLFAAQPGDQISPSAINLSAVGVTEVKFHTDQPRGDVCDDSVAVMLTVDDVLVADTIPISSIGSDSIGHMVINLDWDQFLSLVDVPAGRALFEYSGERSDLPDVTCEETDLILEGEDEAVIIKKLK